MSASSQALVQHLRRMSRRKSDGLPTRNQDCFRTERSPQFESGPHEWGGRTAMLCGKQSHSHKIRLKSASENQILTRCFNRPVIKGRVVPMVPMVPMVPILESCHQVARLDVLACWMRCSSAGWWPARSSHVSALGEAILTCLINMINYPLVI